MRSLTPRALRTPLILLCCAPLASGCVSTRLTPPILAALDCASLIPQSYRSPVPPAPLISTNATAGEALIALDAQTTQLDQANGRTADLIAIADSCGQRQAAILKALDPSPWYDGLLHHFMPPSAAK
ncbi:MAG TPA: hypothetical protein VFB02_14005 [Bradyrhizobium sp.]|nr:hypothetical protein [Bradyrhizobium sp.]